MNNTKDSSAIFGVDNVSEKVANTLVSEESTKRWPEAVRQMYDLFKYELNSAGVDEKLALKLASAMCHHFGGMQVYLGRGKELQRLLRDLQIWNDFNGKNIHELIEKYDICYSQIYRIISRMRAREASKKTATQPSNAI
ncbi:transcriptional regulator [Vibrio fluvialis]|nr:transcriptional regulator [Vibrio fluvialis]